MQIWQPNNNLWIVWKVILISYHLVVGQLVLRNLGELYMIKMCSWFPISCSFCTFIFLLLPHKLCLQFCYVRLDYTKIWDGLISVDTVNKALNCQSGERGERQEECLEARATHKTLQTIASWRFSIKLTEELLSLFSNYFMKLSLLPGFAALEQTDKIYQMS